MEQVVITKRKGTAPSLDEPQGRWAAVAFLTLALAVSACDGSSPTAPSGGPFARELQAVSGNNQTGVSGEALAEPFRVRVTDSGQPLAEIQVLWRVVAGSGEIPGERLMVDGQPVDPTVSTTDADGVAEATLILGDLGRNAVEASTLFSENRLLFEATAQ